MQILAMDPGTEQSAFVLFRDGILAERGIVPNGEICGMISTVWRRADLLALEFVQSFGMPVGREIFEMVWWMGKFSHAAEIINIPVKRIARQKIKSFITGLPGGNDAAVRRALILRYGGANKGQPLEGIKNDMWSALAVACYVDEAIKLGRLEEW